MPELSKKGDRQARAKRRRLIAVLSVVLTTGLCGCTSVSSLRSIASSGTWNDTVEMLRNRSYSAKAWHRRSQNFVNSQYPRDVQAGFRAGYEAIAEGKPGCPPSFPPKEYWSWEFQSAQGQGRIAAWFEGYPYGVQAAREEGVTQWNHLSGSSQCGSNDCGGNNCGGNNCGTGNMVSGYPLQMQMGDQVYSQSDLGTYQVSPNSDSAIKPIPSHSAPDVKPPTPFPDTNN